MPWLIRVSVMYNSSSFPRIIKTTFSHLWRTIRFLRQHPVLTVSLIPLVVVSITALFAQWLPIPDPNSGDIRVSRYLPPLSEVYVLGENSLGREVLSPLPTQDPDRTDLVKRYVPPRPKKYVLGGDSLGRDIMSRLIWGSRISLLIGIAANLAVTVISVFFGLLAGYLGGRVDGVIMRLVDVGLAFPGLLLALVILTVLGPSVVNLAIAVVVSSVPLNIRFFRGQVLTVRTAKYIEAARLLGYSHLRIMFREVLPNVMPLILTVTALHATSFFIFTAGFSLLGMGLKPPDPDWGTMMSDGLRALYEAPAVILGPTILISVLAICFNVLGDETQKILSPRESQL